MTLFSFEIQNCINIEVEAENEVDARMDIVDNIGRYSDQMTQDCYVSDGVEIIGPSLIIYRIF